MDASATASSTWQRSWMPVPFGILVFLAGFLVLRYSIFAQTTGWNALAQRYKAIVEPEGRKPTR